MPDLVPVSAALLALIRDLAGAGYSALIVGGAVRDALLGVAPKDIDAEVYAITYEQLSGFLGRRGRVDLVGRSFGVVKFTHEDGNQWDFSVPRRDNKIGIGHRDFLSTFDAGISPREAASRRDFTMNALAYDPLSGELHDYFGGRPDLENRTLRATSSAFSEDPLRVLRGMQFVCRFDMTLDPATAEMCRAIADQFGTLPKERICEEFTKWAAKSSHPGKIVEYLDTVGWLAHFPLLERLRGVPQDPDWHPEGDVAIHTMHVVDAAAAIAARDGLEGDDRSVLMFSALTHDFAKPDVTELRDKGGRMRWTSYGHEKAGGPLARSFLDDIGVKAEIVDKVARLVENHLAHVVFHGAEIQPRSVRRLAAKLEPATITQLTRLIEADHSGRPPLPPGMPEEARKMRDLAVTLRVESAPPSPLILGRHVLPYFNGKAGKHIGEVVKAAYEAQMDGDFSSAEDALPWLAAYMANRPE
jgi:tRNA nucleotidyltransferase (CCA-adding enzyme)